MRVGRAIPAHLRPCSPEEEEEDHLRRAGDGTVAGREATSRRRPTGGRFEGIIKDSVSSLITPSEKTASYVPAYLH